MFYNLQIEWIHRLQSIWDGALNPFFIFLNNLDKPIFYITLLCLVYFLTSVKSGLRFLSISLISNLAISILKPLFHMPRPCQIDHSIGLICSKTYGFPSGGAQASSLFTLIFLYHVKNPFWRLLSLFYLLLIAFSRVYMGMHFVTDILGGWISGSLIFLFYLYGLPYFEKIGKKIPFPLFVMTFHLATPFFPKYGAIAAGISLGLWTALDYHLLLVPNEKWYKKGILALIGFIVVILIKLFLEQGPLAFYLIGLWISLGSILILRIIFPKTSKWTSDSFP